MRDLETRARRLSALSREDSHEGVLARRRLDALLEKNPNLSSVVDLDVEVTERVVLPFGRTRESVLLCSVLARALGCVARRSPDGEVFVSGRSGDVQRFESLMYWIFRETGRTGLDHESVLQGVRHGIVTVTEVHPELSVGEGVEFIEEERIVDRDANQVGHRISVKAYRKLRHGR